MYKFFIALSLFITAPAICMEVDSHRSKLLPVIRKDMRSLASSAKLFQVLHSEQPNLLKNAINNLTTTIDNLEQDEKAAELDALIVRYYQNRNKFISDVPGNIQDADLLIATLQEVASPKEAASATGSSVPLLQRFDTAK